ncbi:cysteine-rich CWC family protein [Parafilimonas sp.]|uniref:cysteine-rich CWC family protein n=1 Tax=Parafilimonas sp. TaxID=1969739 RepID=UPI0039E46668
MPVHEEKVCPRCGCVFECKAGDITQCQCYGIQFSLEERVFIEERYRDCLCADCLLELKNRYVLFKERYLLKPK